MTKNESALDKVQDLYVLQVNLWNVLDAKKLSDAQRADARRNLREFASLLRKADWEVMGGEDVYVSLKQMQKEVAQKLSARGEISRKPSVRTRVTRKNSKK